jgi:hypothetical protein
MSGHFVDIAAGRAYLAVPEKCNGPGCWYSPMPRMMTGNCASSAIFTPPRAMSCSLPRSPPSSTESGTSRPPSRPCAPAANALGKSARSASASAASSPISRRSKPISDLAAVGSAGHVGRPTLVEGQGKHRMRRLQPHVDTGPTVAAVGAPQQHADIALEAAARRYPELPRRRYRRPPP